MHSAENMPFKSEKISYFCELSLGVPHLHASDLQFVPQVEVASVHRLIHKSSRCFISLDFIIVMSYMLLEITHVGL